MYERRGHVSIKEDWHIMETGPAYIEIQAPVFIILISTITRRTESTTVPSIPGET